MAVVAAVMGIAQLAAARWRDLGSFTVGLTSAALLMHTEPWVVPLAAVTAALAGCAWFYGASNGVGRPGLVGVTIVIATWCHLAVLVGLKVDLGVVGCLVSGMWCGLPALERPAPRRRRPRAWRKVPIDG